MTNQLQKQFFDTFGVEPKYKCTKDGNCYFQECSKCGWYTRTYPQITDRILLELICIINQIDLYFYDEYDYFMAVNYKDLKEEVIVKCKRLADKNAFSEITGENIKHQVRTLFEENN